MAQKNPEKRKLTAKQQAAVVARAKPDCKSNIAAVLASYPKSNNWTRSTVARFACDLFKKPHVSLALEREMDKIRSRGRNRSAISAQRVIQEFQAIALASLPDIVQYETKKGPHGVKIFVMKITDFDQLTDDTKKAIKKIKMKSRPQKDEDGETIHIIQEVEFELYDKQKALDSLAKYFDLYVEKLEVHHTGTIGVVHTSAQELKVLFDAMTPDERAGHLAKLTEGMMIDVTNDHKEEEG